MTFWIHWRKWVFPERSIRVIVIQEAKTVNIVILLTWSRKIIAKCSNGSKDIVGKRQNNNLSQTNVSCAWAL